MGKLTEEQLNAIKLFAGEKKPSMKRRAEGHDYTERRMYMITIEVEGRKPLFGRLIGFPFAEQGSADAPRIELTALGKAVEREWMGITGYYPQIEVRALQMMPDHLHGILFVQDTLPVHLGQVIAGFKAGCRRAMRELEAAAGPLPTEKGTTRNVTAEPLPTEKGRPLSSLQVTALPSQEGVKQPYHPLFAKGYNDLILRNYEELQRWENYLRDNPRRLLMKRLRPEWLRPFFGFTIGETTYNGIGNRNLLKAPHRLVVRLSRRLTPEQIAEETAHYMAEARRGAVLISPAISPAEKHVMRTAFNAGFPTVVIMENGFTPLSKPKGEQFDACAVGRLLMISPWEHHNEKHKVTAAQCTQMNLMAMKLCEYHL